MIIFFFKAFFIWRCSFAGHLSCLWLFLTLTFTSDILECYLKSRYRLLYICDSRELFCFLNLRINIFGRFWKYFILIFKNYIFPSLCSLFQKFYSWILDFLILSYIDLILKIISTILCLWTVFCLIVVSVLLLALFNIMFNLFTKFFFFILKTFIFLEVLFLQVFYL